ncbi:MAG: sulfatase, partial [Planctomycetes bacterium]|nr:sulfatase [Planctomycetota bacterium]
IREPWLMRVPGVTEPGSVCRSPISSIDAMPTLLELAGVPAVAHEIDGRSFAALLRGANGEDAGGAGAAATADFAERPLFWHYPHYGNQGGFPSAAVRVGDYKLIERLEDGRVHLFDLRRDPGERNDLAAAEPGRVDEMRTLLHAWYRRHDARFLRAKEGGPEPWHPR